MSKVLTKEERNGLIKNGAKATRNSRLQKLFMFAKRQFGAALKTNREYARSSSMTAIQHERPI